MTLNETLLQATEAMATFQENTRRMREGTMSPNDIDLNGRDLNAAHWSISEVLSQFFNSKEESEMNRKTMYAEKYAEYRETSKSSKEAEEQTYIAIKAELEAERIAHRQFKHLQYILNSLEKAIDQNRSTLSLIKQNER